MATVVNTPPSGQAEGDGSSLGLIVGIIVALLLIGLFVMYGLPAMNDTGPGDTNINLPTPTPTPSPTPTPTPSPTPTTP